MPIRVVAVLRFLVSWRLPRLLLCGAACLLATGAVWIYLNFTTLQEYFHARDRRDSYQSAVAGLGAEYARLVAEERGLMSDGFDKEKTIRERLLMVREGEEILFVIPPEADD